jgi:hypothetical protein
MASITELLMNVEQFVKSELARETEVLGEKLIPLSIANPT